MALTYCRRNPHDLYHYENPDDRVIKGTVHPPRLRMTNEKIILRHMVATALSAFFRKNGVRFETVTEFGGDWSIPSRRIRFGTVLPQQGGLRRLVAQDCTEANA